MSHRIARLVFFLPCLWLAGCGSALKLNQINLQITELRQTTGGLVLTLRYENSNATQLVITASTHTLWLDNRLVGRIETTTPVGLPMFAHATKQVAIPEALAPQILAIFAERQGAVEYRIRSKCSVTIRFEEDTLHGSGSGTLSLEK